MTEAEAYPCGRTYVTRASAHYVVGEIVYVGPANRDGEYQLDGLEGLYTVIATTMCRDYQLCRHSNGDDVTIYAARLSGRNN